MKVLFLTISCINDISKRGIYNDLMRKIRDEGHELCIASPRPRFMNEATSLKTDNNVSFLGVKTWNVTKSKNVIEKGIGQLLIEGQFIRAIRKYLDANEYDLILYSTPPVTFSNVIKYLKKKAPKAKTYLLLKDIFPQNAVDIGMMTTTGIKGLIYKYFRKKEKELYTLSDNIGCMSPANVEYVLKQNPYLAPDKVEVAPNSIDLKKEPLNEGDRFEMKNERDYIRSKYSLPLNRPIFIYGGNLGKPQGIPYLIDCLDANADRDDCFFIIIGSGTERVKIEEWYKFRNPKSVILMDKMEKDAYDMLLKSCDVGLIFLDYRFTIPNYPSRLLPYLENKMPVLCATDENTDVGRIAEENGYGYWCSSTSVNAFTAILDRMIQSDLRTMGEKGYEFLCMNYLVANTYETIFKHV